MREPRRYEEVRGDLKSGDLVLCDGAGKLSGIIKWFSGPYSHAGILAKSQELDLLGVMESTTLAEMEDAETGQVQIGVRFVEFSNFVANYPGRVFVRQLSGALDSDRLAALARFRREIKGLDYEEKKRALAMAALRDFGGEEDLSSLFCSELVAEALQRMRLIHGPERGGRQSDNWTPTELSAKSGWGSRLLDGYSYHPEWEVRA